MNKKIKKSIFKDLARKIGWSFMVSSVAFCGLIPLSVNYFLGSILGSLAYLAVGRHRKVALESLLIAFKDKTLKQRKKIVRDFFIFMAQGSFELLHYLKNPKELDNVRLDGKKNLDLALDKGKGVIIVTAHLGNFPIMSLKLAKIGFDVSFVTRPMRDQRVGDYLRQLRANAGVKTIHSYPRRECVNSIIKALRSNEIVIMQMDQNFGTGGVWVKFFGKLAATPVGPISLGLRTGAALVPAYIYRREKKKHTLKIMPQEELVITGQKGETVLVNAIKITKIIEKWIIEHPFQWGWIHRRWKSRPSEKVKALKYKVQSD